MKKRRKGEEKTRGNKLEIQKIEKESGEKERN